MKPVGIKERAKRVGVEEWRVRGEKRDGKESYTGERRERRG